MTASTGSTGSTGSTMTGRLTALADARTVWLSEMIGRLQQVPFVAGVCLVGSLATGTADAFSDIDLIVVVDDTTPATVFADPVAGLGWVGPVLYVRPKPRNAPEGGAYLAVCLELTGLPVLVDLYVWPATTMAVPASGRMLIERNRLPRSDLELLDLLARHPADDQRGSDPDDPATLLLLTQLAAKYHARHDLRRRAAICHQLHIPDITAASKLRHVLDVRLPALRPAPTAALAAVDRLLDLVSGLKR